MNVLDAIKDTLLSVPKDITTGIKSLTTRDSVTEDRQDEPDLDLYVRDQGVNFDAGGELLSKFQEHWSELHQKSEGNAKTAKKTDGLVGELFLYLERQNDAVNQFLIEISTLPQLMEDLGAVTHKLENLEGQFEALESELLALEDVCEEQELLRNRRHHEYQLAVYQQKRSAELEQAKVQMARSHAGKVQKYEMHLQKSLREKQQAFEATFKEEMQHYKKYGKTSPLFKPPSGKASPAQQRSLDDFVPDELTDSSALDAFFQSENTTDARSTNIPSIEAVTADSGTGEMAAANKDLQPPTASSALEQALYTEQSDPLRTESSEPGQNISDVTDTEKEHIDQSEETCDNNNQSGNPLDQTLNEGQIKSPGVQNIESSSTT